MKILDCGCGSQKYHSPLRGDVVSVDKEVTSFNRSFLDVRCDAHHLPFKDSAFDIVYASHILEHLFDPLAFLKEIERVARKKVIIRVPNLLFPDQMESENHIFSWSKNSLKNLLSLVFDRVEIVGSYGHGFPHLSLFKRFYIIFMEYLISIVIREVEIIAVCQSEKPDSTIA
jgi:SAM-dependent methyltransferase